MELGVNEMPREKTAALDLADKTYEFHFGQLFKSPEEGSREPQVTRGLILDLIKSRLEVAQELKRTMPRYQHDTMVEKNLMDLDMALKIVRGEVTTNAEPLNRVMSQIYNEASAASAVQYGKDVDKQGWGISAWLSGQRPEREHQLNEAKDRYKYRQDKLLAVRNFVSHDQESWMKGEKWEPT